MSTKKSKPNDETPNEAHKPIEPETTTIKKSAPRKRVASKKQATVKKAAVKKGVSRTTADSVAASELSALRAELQLLEQQGWQRAEAHEAKLSQLMQGLDKTFGHLQQSSSEQTQKLGNLMSGLDKTFQNIHLGNQNRDDSNVSSLDKISQTIILSSEELRKEYEEMERLQEQKLVAEKEQHQHNFNILKVIAVPAIILAVFGIGYMFYTVTVMERAMTAMSGDMGAMRVSMAEMTTSVGEMNSSISNIDNNVKTMSGNMQGMRQDLNVLTRNVAPAMDGMRQMMPWSP